MLRDKTIRSNLRLFLRGFRIFLVLPQKVPETGDVVTSRAYKFAFTVVLVIALACAVFVRVFLNAPKEPNSYNNFGLARAIFASACVAAITLITISRSERITHVFNRLLEMEERVTLDRGDAWRMRAIVLFEIAAVFTFLAVFVQNTLSLEGENLLSRYILAVSQPLVGVASYASEITFMNACLIVERYMLFCHREIDRMLESDGGVSREGIGRIKRLYGEIYSIKDELYRIFSFILLMSLSICLVNMVFYVFVNIVKFQNGTHLPLEKDLFVTLFGAVMTVKLFILSTICEGLKDTMNRTAVLVSRLWSNAEDEEEKTLLSSFLKETDSMDSTISSSGFAIIDHRLFNSMMANIFMYVVMLFQFDFPDYGTNPVSDLLVHS
ncbi:UNVERIFIED_CONTAM: hypothetical protein PYX00_005903 [Menopon gallinae]|uniref:Gustatory receptor n=1 Tax=Menopon gallinae TaxID=328185 RepID=A0AAW2HUG1_9NEOP